MVETVRADEAIKDTDLAIKALERALVVARGIRAKMETVTSLEEMDKHMTEACEKDALSLFMLALPGLVATIPDGGFGPAHAYALARMADAVDDVAKAMFFGEMFKGMTEEEVVQWVKAAATGEKGSFN